MRTLQNLIKQYIHNFTKAQVHLVEYLNFIKNFYNVSSFYICINFMQGFVLQLKKIYALAQATDAFFIFCFIYFFLFFIGFFVLIFKFRVFIILFLLIFSFALSFTVLFYSTNLSKSDKYLEPLFYIFLSFFFLTLPYMVISFFIIFILWNLSLRLHIKRAFFYIKFLLSLYGYWIHYLMHYQEGVIFFIILLLLLFLLFLTRLNVFFHLGFSIALTGFYIICWSLNEVLYVVFPFSVHILLVIFFLVLFYILFLRFYGYKRLCLKLNALKLKDFLVILCVGCICISLKSMFIFNMLIYSLLEITSLIIVDPNSSPNPHGWWSLNCNTTNNNFSRLCISTHSRAFSMYVSKDQLSFNSKAILYHPIFTRPKNEFLSPDLHNRGYTLTRSPRIDYPESAETIPVDTKEWPRSYISPFPLILSDDILKKYFIDVSEINKREHRRLANFEKRNQVNLIEAADKCDAKNNPTLPVKDVLHDEFKTLKKK